MSTIVHVVGTRPNFVKVAPVVEALKGRPRIRQILVHTGQHYDAALSDAVLHDIGLPAPDRYLGVGSGSHAEQTGRVMIELEHILLLERPDLVVVVGDVNSTLGAALAAAKVGVPIAHVESGLRSFDWTMPEEINRVVTDRLSQFLFTHSPEAEHHLAREGIDGSLVHYVGNTMIDTLLRLEPAARARQAWANLGVAEHEYVLVTLHRPSNVDEPARLLAIVDRLVALARTAPVVFPVHPRTMKQLGVTHGLARLEEVGVRCLEPLPYVEFLSLELGAGAMITDSGGIQEETTVLGIPCFTLRKGTERPITVELGTNVVLGEDPAALERVRLSDSAPRRREIPLWDGHAGERAAAVLVEALARGA